MLNAKHYISNGLWLMVAMMAILLSGCRRDLWEYANDKHEVLLETDWTEATERPGGMTWWFIREDGSGMNYHAKTGNVTQAWINIPRGWYEGVVFDYSTDEYAHQEFVGMDQPSTAMVRLLPSADQPSEGEELFGDKAVEGFAYGIETNEATGLYMLAAEPEVMNADTLRHQLIQNGNDDIYVKWDGDEHLDTTTSTVIKQTLHAKPRPIVWQLKVRVELKGYQYMGDVRATVAGLADGCYFFPLRHSGNPCLQYLGSWGGEAINDSVGYIATTVNTFGLSQVENPIVATSRADGDTYMIEYMEKLRLNLQFLLRDGKTIKDYHYNVNEGSITIDNNELVVIIDIPIDYPGSGGAPNLPPVAGNEPASFDAIVSPWEEGATADETM